MPDVRQQQSPWKTATIATKEGRSSCRCSPLGEKRNPWGKNYIPAPLPNSHPCTSSWACLHSSNGGAAVCPGPQEWVFWQHWRWGTWGGRGPTEEAQVVLLPLGVLQRWWGHACPQGQGTGLLRVTDVTHSGSHVDRLTVARAMPAACQTNIPLPGPPCNPGVDQLTSHIPSHPILWSTIL